MRYRIGLLITAGQLETNPAIEIMGLVPGTITEVEINFPAGHSGLTYVQIWYQERQIFPTTPGVAFRGDDTVINFGATWDIHEVPYEVEILGWAPLATLDHIVFVDITIKSIVEQMTFLSRAIGLPEGFL